MAHKINDLENKILEMYREDLNYDDAIYGCDNDICNGCRKKESDFLGAWLVGDKFGENGNRIVFVGKTGRGSVNKLGDEFNESREILWDSKYPFWNAIKEISKNIFNNDPSPEHVAVTNIIKCNDSDSKKTATNITSKSRKDNCIDNLKVLKGELKILKPTEVIFFIGTDYDKYLYNPGSVFDGIKVKKSNGGNGSIPWDESVATLGNLKEIRVLRTRHPQFAPAGFVGQVTAWI